MLRILLVLAVWESIRDNFALSQLITRLKDVFLILLCVSTAAKSRWLLDTRFFSHSAYGWFFLYLLLTIPISVYSSTTPFGMELNIGSSISWAFHLRAFYFCALVYTLLCYFKQYPYDIVSLTSVLCVACTFFVAFNLVAYFYHFPFMTQFRPQPGRISNGYPTSDALMLLMAALAYRYTLWSGARKDYLILGLLTIGVIANATTSGLAALILLAVYYSTSRFRQRPVKTLLIISAVVIAILLVLASGYLLLDHLFHKDLEKIQALYRLKSDEVIALMNGDVRSSNSGTNSSSMRIDQFTDVYKFNESPLDFMVGLGSFYGNIENEFLHVLVVWGFVGLALFLATIYETYSATAKALRSIAVGFIIIWIMAGIVLTTTYLFPLFVPFAIYAAALMTKNCASYWNIEMRATLNPEMGRTTGRAL